MAIIAAATTRTDGQNYGSNTKVPEHTSDMDAQNHHYPSHPPSHRHHDHHDPFCGVGHPVAMVVSGGRGRGGAGRGGDGGGGGGFGFVVVVFMVVCCPSRRYTCPCSRLPAAVASSPTACCTRLATTTRPTALAWS